MLSDGLDISNSYQTILKKCKGTHLVYIMHDKWILRTEGLVDQQEFKNTLVAK